MFIKLVIFKVLLILSMNYAYAEKTEAVWIDVRSVLEHKLDHIDGDIRVSHGDIVVKASTINLAKDAEIRLYCRSGGRAGKAMEALKKAGYTNVENVGSIQNARKVRGIEKP